MHTNLRDTNYATARSGIEPGPCQRNHSRTTCKLLSHRLC